MPVCPSDRGMAVSPSEEGLTSVPVSPSNRGMASTPVSPCEALQVC